GRGAQGQQAGVARSHPDDGDEALRGRRVGGAVLRRGALRARAGRLTVGGIGVGDIGVRRGGLVRFGALRGGALRGGALRCGAQSRSPINWSAPCASSRSARSRPSCSAASGWPLADSLICRLPSYAATVAVRCNFSSISAAYVPTGAEQPASRTARIDRSAVTALLVAASST